MKKTLHFFVFANLLLLSTLDAQECQISTGTATLDVNNIEAILQASGDFWWDRSGAGYFVPKPSPGQPKVASIFAGGLWVGGVDPAENLKIAGQTYGAANGQTDWWPGPLSLDGGSTDANNCTNFDRLWKVERADIDAHIADFQDNGVIDGPVPQTILAWPGQGNPESFDANGFDLPDQPLAPFYDRNSNGLYEPMLGDYPNVPGDQAIWWVFNDEGGGHTHDVTNGFTMRVEVHALAYASAAESVILANTTFYDFTVINRAKENLDSAHVSLWMDVDLGCPVDDYLGCLPEERLAFFYNEDSLDGSVDCTCPGSISTYCEDIPLLGVKVLRGPKNAAGEDMGFSSFMYFGDPALGAPPPPFTLWYDVGFYRYMTGAWGDGVPLTYGGNGYDVTSTDYTDFAFPGNPSELTGWTQCTEDLPAFDRKALINSGPFSLEPGQKTSVCYAVMSHFGATHPCPDITPLVVMGDEVEEFCESLTAVENVQHADFNLQLSPNPLHTEAKLTLKNAGETMQQVLIFRADGQLVRSYKNLKTNELTIRRDGLPAGMYFYKIQTNAGRWSAGRLAVQ